jgi:hypothetical protein
MSLLSKIHQTQQCHSAKKYLQQLITNCIMNLVRIIRYQGYNISSDCIFKIACKCFLPLEYNKLTKYLSMAKHQAWPYSSQTGGQHRRMWRTHWEAHLREVHTYITVCTVPLFVRTEKCLIQRSSYLKGQSSEIFIQFF